jgi:hypothetical protein
VKIKSIQMAFSLHVPHDRGLTGTVAGENVCKVKDFNDKTIRSLKECVP